MSSSTCTEWRPGQPATPPGKVTSQHGLCYARLAAEHGEETARLYGEANEAGVAMVAELAAEASADCDLTRAPAYVYTTDDKRVGDIEREATVAARLGLPAVLADPVEVPFENALAAVRFHDQLHLDAYRYCTALASSIISGGGAVHEHTRATRVRERSDHVVVETDHGIVRANHAVIATLLPFVDSGGFFARARASRAYGLAARLRSPAPVGHVHHLRAADAIGTPMARWRTERRHRRRRGARDRQRSRHGGPLPAPRDSGPGRRSTSSRSSTRGRRRTTPPSTTSPMSAVNRCDGGPGSPPAIASGVSAMRRRRRSCSPRRSMKRSTRGGRCSTLAASAGIAPLLASCATTSRLVAISSATGSAGCGPASRLARSR